MNLRLPLAAALALLSAAAPLSAQQLPRTITARVLDATDGTPARGATWRSWSVIDPAGSMMQSSAASAIGTARADGLWATAATPAGESASLLDRVVAIELGAFDAQAPGGIAGYVAVLRSARIPRLASLAPVQLAALPSPEALAGPSAVQVTFPPMTDGVAALTDANGLLAYAIERSPAGGDAFVEVARATASATGVAIDDPAPAGRWEYAVRAIYSGNVPGRDLSRKSAPVDVTSSACDEPSAGTAASPLLLARDRATGTVTATWASTAATSYGLYLVTLPAMHGGSYVLRSLAEPASASAPLPARLDPRCFFLVAAHCGTSSSAAGHDSYGIVIPAP